MPARGRRSIIGAVPVLLNQDGRLPEPFQLRRSGGWRLPPFAHAGPLGGVWNYRGGVSRGPNCLGTVGCPLAAQRVRAVEELLAIAVWVQL